jgi:hypothetical protein
MHRFYGLSFCVLSVTIILTGRQLAFAQGDDRPNGRFGVIESYESPQDAADLGVAWTRVQLHWAEIQSNSSSDWNPEITDQEIEREIEGGRMVVGLLIGIPEWARDGKNLPQGLWLPHDDPENTWANYVRQVVSYYKGRVNHWIIWNEPDIRSTELGHTWDGSVADFAQLQRIAYLVAKDVDPHAVIHLSAFSYWADYNAGTRQYMGRLLDELKDDPHSQENNTYFDVASAHLYFQPNQIYDLLQLFTTLMRNRGLEQEIWLVETNAPPKDDPAWPVPNWTLSVTLEEQAAFIPQALSSAIAAGAERVAIYKLKDTEEDQLANPEPFGLLRLDGSRRPSFDAFKTAIDYLSDAMLAERERWDEVGQIRVDQPDHTTTVVFSRLPSAQPQQAEVRATDETAQLVDMWGTSQTISPTQGVYIIDLPPARCSQSIGDYCMIGGPTYYLVQAAETQPATKTVTPTIVRSIETEATSTAIGTVTATFAQPTSGVTGAMTPELIDVETTAIVTALETTTSIASIELETDAFTRASTGVNRLALGGVLLLLFILGIGLVFGRRRS